MSIFTMLEPLAEQAFNALAPTIQNLLHSLPVALQPAALPIGESSGIGPQASVLKNLSVAMPSITADGFNKMTAQIGEGIAAAATAYEVANPGSSVKVYITSPAGYQAAATLAEAGFKSSGLDVTMIPSNTLLQMISSGIEMYVAGVGTQAIKVAA